MVMRLRVTDRRSVSQCQGNGQISDFVIAPRWRGFPVGGKIMMQADLERLHKYMIEIEGAIGLWFCRVCLCCCAARYRHCDT
jgi:hypothetical protein